MSLPSRWLGCILLIGAFVALHRPAASQPAESELAWVEDVLLRANFLLKETQTGTRHFVGSPKITVIGGTKEHRKTVSEVVVHLNETLKKTPLKGIAMLKPNDPTATIRVHFLKRDQIPTIAAYFGARPPVVNLIAKEKWVVYNTTQSNPMKLWEIRSGLALISSDKEHADYVRRNVLLSLCRILGFLNYSKSYPDSVFYRDGNRRSVNEKLSERDQKLVIWCYNHVPPGTTALKKIYEDHWQDRP